MTIHDWLESFSVNERRKLPSNDTADSLIYYARSRFGYTMVDDGCGNLQRVEPHCKVCGARCPHCVPQ